MILIHTTKHGLEVWLLVVGNDEVRCFMSRGLAITTALRS
jgi:hypothetical protein